MEHATFMAAKEYFEAQYPHEGVGFVVIVKGRERFMPCKNLAEKSTSQFVIDPVEQSRIEDMGEIVELLHSHPNASAEPSQLDRIHCESSGLQWSIFSMPEGVVTDVYTFRPDGYVLPLEGRRFVHGEIDCYTLCKDWYEREMGLTLPNFEREDEWWNKGQDLYKDNFAKAGFVQVFDAPKRGDGILMQVRSDVMNHAAVYLGDGTIIHHLPNRLSSRDLYAGYFLQITRMVVRHESNL